MQFLVNFSDTPYIYTNVKQHVYTYVHTRTNSSEHATIESANSIPSSDDEGKRGISHFPFLSSLLERISTDYCTIRLIRPQVFMSLVFWLRLCICTKVMPGPGIRQLRCERSRTMLSNVIAKKCCGVPIAVDFSILIIIRIRAMTNVNLNGTLYT